ncbi:hypothetical protein HNV12_02775 [Methanococcoides sp. SA1]|nr:hypothetical protein [Methanococcoides sp. SA1]
MQLKAKQIFQRRTGPGRIERKYELTWFLQGDYFLKYNAYPDGFESLTLSFIGEDGEKIFNVFGEKGGEVYSLVHANYKKEDFAKEGIHLEGNVAKETKDLLTRGIEKHCLQYEEERAKMPKYPIRTCR